MISVDTVTVLPCELTMVGDVVKLISVVLIEEGGGVGGGTTKFVELEGGGVGGGFGVEDGGGVGVGCCVGMQSMLQTSGQFS